MPTIMGVNLGHEFFVGGGGPEALEKQSQIIRIHPESALQSLEIKKFCGNLTRLFWAAE